MGNEIYIKPFGYEKWFAESEAFGDTAVMLNKFTPNNDVTEIVMNLTDCLKEFFVVARGLVENIDTLYKKENHYLIRPLITQLIVLKKNIYDSIDDILNNVPDYIKAESSDSYFKKLVKKGILTNEDMELLEDLLNGSFQEVAEGIICRSYNIHPDYSEDSPEVNFSIKSNMHVNVDETPILILDAPYEVEPGLINLKYWTASELFRVNRMTEICAKIATGSSEIKKGVISKCFDGRALISVFEQLKNM